MEKLELKHLAPYLPYKVKILVYDAYVDSYDTSYTNIKGIKEIELNSRWLSVLEYERNCKTEVKNFPFRIKNKEYQSNKLIKPILRPLSDLKKEIIINNKKVVPFYDILRRCDDQISCHKLRTSYLTGECDAKEFNVYMFNMLLSYHFDVFGLIEKELAIDINTL